ncbi:hypothetical protein Gohar_008354, partial [Gossypium harknessii]|nr:hypothetical protein [Gossypium harknessii]
GVTNRLRWYLESPCEYTVQSGYKILLKVFPRTEEDQETRICLRCGEDSETNMHASRDCLLALQVWQELGINWRVNQTKDCMANWVRQLFFGSGNQKKLIAIIAIWAIWLSRNKLVHEGKQQSKTETVTFILGYVHELELLTGKRVEQAAEEIVVWRSPSNPFVRVNFEAIFYKDDSKTGGGEGTIHSSGQLRSIDKVTVEIENSIIASRVKLLQIKAVQSRF